MPKSKNTGQIDPSEFTITYGTHTVQGYADGTYITVAYSANTWELIKGADGEAARVRTNDDSVTITVTLLQTAASNTVLSGLDNIDRKTGAGSLPLFIKDNNGDTQGGGAVAWIEKAPDINNSKTVEPRAWVFRVPHYEGVVGGNAQL